MTWIFGYGSLIWRPGIVYAERIKAELPGWRRSFAQKSLDHRGTPDAPGRVLTLRACERTSCMGIAYRIESPNWADTLTYLDHREKGGYERIRVYLKVRGSLIQAITYIAPPGNPHDAGEESYEEIAQIVNQANGPSGPNTEYIWALAEAFQQDGIQDEELANLIGAMQRTKNN